MGGFVLPWALLAYSDAREVRLDSPIHPHESEAAARRDGVPVEHVLARLTPTSDDSTTRQIVESWTEREARRASCWLVLECRVFRDRTNLVIRFPAEIAMALPATARVVAVRQLGARPDSIWLHMRLAGGSTGDRFFARVTPPLPESVVVVVQPARR